MGERAAAFRLAALWALFYAFAGPSLLPSSLVIAPANTLAPGSGAAANAAEWSRPAVVLVALLCVQTLAVFTLSRLRVALAAVLNLALGAAAFLSVWGVHSAHLRAADFTSSLFPIVMLLVVASIGISAAYENEQLTRNDYLKGKLLERERSRSEGLLLNILPPSVAERLKDEEQPIADGYEQVSVLFADVVGFTPLSADLSAPEVVNLLNQVFSAFDELAHKHGLEKIKTIGDAYMAAAGLPEPRPDHAEAVARMALEMREAARGFLRPEGTQFELRIGINTGPVVAGVIGTKKFIYDLWGDTVNLASRMESHGSPGMIQVTEATYQALNQSPNTAAFAFGPRREVEVKGRGIMAVYELRGWPVSSLSSLFRSASVSNGRTAQDGAG